jgi:hypothetical protein
MLATVWEGELAMEWVAKLAVMSVISVPFSHISNVLCYIQVLLRSHHTRTYSNMNK